MIVLASILLVQLPCRPVFGSRLDYCNSVLYGATKAKHCEAATCSEQATWLVADAARRISHITSILSNPHWLPLSQRINFNICRYHIQNNKMADHLICETFYRFSGFLEICALARLSDWQPKNKKKEKTSPFSAAFCHTATYVLNNLSGPYKL